MVEKLFIINMAGIVREETMLQLRSNSRLSGGNRVLGRLLGHGFVHRGCSRMPAESAERIEVHDNHPGSG